MAKYQRIPKILIYASNLPARLERVPPKRFSEFADYIRS